MSGETALAGALAVARGDAPADFVFTNCQIINVFSGEIERADIALSGDRIAGIGNGYRGREMIDLAGAFVAPGLIDAHVHIESSLCTPPHYASAVLSRGVTTVVTDPHEIANVAGVPGIRFMIESSRGLPLRVVIMAPSCVPATELSTSGARIDAGALAKLLKDNAVHGLAEMMNFPGVIAGDRDVTSKLNAFGTRPIDGHAPGVSGAALNAYVLSGIGSDHECVTVDEAREKLSRGLYILIREATNAHNLDALLPLITPENSRRICFCTDDRQPADLLGIGGVDDMVRRAIAYGIEPVTAFRLATLNAAEWFNLRDRGAIAPGRFADLMVFDDLRSPVARRVYSGGRKIAENGCVVVGVIDASIPPAVLGTCSIDWRAVDLTVPARAQRIRVIGARPQQLITDALIEAATIQSGVVRADPEGDILKIAVVGRHSLHGRTGIGFIRGFGLKRGAIAGTVAHDHHNLIIVGCDDVSMQTAGRAVTRLGGGLAVAEGDHTVAVLPLPVAGLMSDRPINEVRLAFDRLLSAAAQLGATLDDPFMAMSFMALEVIPSLKVTDQGLVDVEAFKHVDLFVS